ncbi:MAG: kelch repeat-containing protein [Ilyomonas sp.]
MVHVCLIELNAQGLQFNSNDSLLTKRTSLNVFNSKPVTFTDHLYIDFDLSIWDTSNLGYICNIAEKNTSYSLSYLYINGAGFLNFNIDSKSNKIKIPLASSLLKRKKWMKVKMNFNLITDELTLALNNTVFHATKLGLKNTITAQIFFGKNPLYTEVPRMAIRNLSVGDNSKKYFFPLNEWSGNKVHDAEGEVIGNVVNPFWLTTESYFWKPVHTLSFKDVAGLNFNPLDQNLSIFSKDSLITYNAENKDLIARPYKNAMPVTMVLGKNIINLKENKCYIYELFDVPTGAPSIASLNLDLNNLEWQTVGKATWPNQLHHHNVFYDATDDTIYLFGGYGVYKYHNSFLYYNNQSDKWQPQAFTGNKITPRFFAASGPSDKPDEIFLFGGYGNESGNQVVGGRRYYDLYRINIKNHTIKKCWELHPDGEVFVPANNLILSPDKKYFYALCYQHEVAKTQLSLYKFSVDDGSYDVVSAPIPVTSERIESDMNLFYNSNTNEFLCTTQEFTDRNNSTIKIFSLEGPPLSKTLYLQSLRADEPSDDYLTYIIITAASVLLVLAILFLRKKSAKKQEEEIVEKTTEAVIEIPAIEKEATKEVIEERTRNAIYLLGDFSVHDEKGMDITHLFSPKIKRLFVLILINSINGEGISSKKISSVLWPDKEYSKTKNIRGVTFNHLRNAISSIPQLELVFSGDNYFFKLNDEVFCDYVSASEILNSSELPAEKLPILLRGGLMQQMHETWLEEAKYDYEQRLIKLLTNHLKKIYHKNNLKPVLEISRHILRIEPFNEEAFKYQIAALKKLKGADHAKKIFDQYAEEYKRSLGIDCPIDFDSASPTRN